MDHRRLRYFVAVAEELHFGRAARRLHIAQQPLSQQIRRLEAEVGVRLFERTSRRVELTAAGRAFLEEVRELFRLTERAVETARRVERGEVGRLTVGYASSAIYNVLPETVLRFRERYPGVELILQELNAMPLERALAVGEADVGLLCPPLREPDLVAETVLREPLLAVLRSGHPLAERDAVPLDALAAEPFVLYQRTHKPTLCDYIIALCQQAGFSPRVVQEAATEHAMVALVAAGMGVSLVTRSQSTLGHPGTVCLPILEANAEVELVAAYRSGDTSPLTRCFVATAVEVGQGIPRFAPVAARLAT